MVRTVTGFFDFQVKKMAMERMVLMNLTPDFFGIKNHCTTANLVQFSEPSGLKLPWKNKKQFQSYAVLKEIRLLGYSEQRRVKYTHCEPRKLAVFDAACLEFVTRQDICRDFSVTPKKCAQHVLRFPDLLFSSTRLVELLLWLDKPLLNPTTWFGKRHG